MLPSTIRIGARVGSGAGRLCQADMPAWFEDELNVCCSPGEAAPRRFGKELVLVHTVPVRNESEQACLSPSRDGDALSAIICVLASGAE